MAENGQDYNWFWTPHIQLTPCLCCTHRSQHHTFQTRSENFNIVIAFLIILSKIWSLSDLDVSVSHVLIDPVNEEFAPLLRHYDGVCSLQEFILLKFLFQLTQGQYSGIWVVPVFLILAAPKSSNIVGQGHWQLNSLSIQVSRAPPTINRWKCWQLSFREREKRVEDWIGSVAQNNISI